MSLIDKTYFINEIDIPNNEYAPTNVGDIITRYEPEILKQLLGYELAKEVQAYDVNTSTQAIKDLVEGKEYTLNGYLTKWVGFKNDEKYSLIAYYVWYNWAKINATHTGVQGQIKQLSENSQLAPIAGKVGSNWIELERLYYDAWAFLTEHSEDYPTWDFCRIGNVNAFDL